MQKIIEMYKKFRQELDGICIPIILDDENVREIKADGKTVGMICGTDDYIDCIYILPEYRRKGLATKAALEWVKDFRKYGEIRLHIINDNVKARKFWNKLFYLDPLEGNRLDTLYRITGIRGEKQ